MKILLPSTLILLWNKINIFITILPLIILMMMIKSSNNLIMLNSMFNIDSLSSIMIILSLMSVLLIIISSMNLSLKETNLLIFPILITLLMVFSMSNMFNFYIMFEMILIPTMILITKSGKQPERLQAGIYLMIYTITSSLPLLISITFMKTSMSFTMMIMYIYKFKLILLMMMAFLVKMPMFFTHLWLPKAHVEAPLEGSMILAAVLLKMGGYGLIRIMPICLTKISMISYWIMSISLLGAIFTSLNCVRQKDMKSLIAYSSVAHMGLTLSSIFSLNHIGLYGAIIMMIAHGLSSSALFLLVNDLYLKLHSRNITLFKGLMILTPNIVFWWFMFMAINISAPPSINTLSEIFILSSLMLWSTSLIIPLILSSFTTASFSLSLFINITHNKNETHPFSQTTHKTLMSLFFHFIPLLLMLSKTEIMYMYMSSLQKQ